MLLSLSLAAVLSLVPLATAQGAAYSQCGGVAWTGATTCVSGYTCVFSSAYYSQCVPATTTVAASKTSTKASSTATSTTSTKTSSSASASASSTAASGLNVAAKAAGKKYFGSATDNPELTDLPYVAILSNASDFGQLTPGNSMKWDATEPEQGTFTFAAGQAIVSLAQGNDQLIRGHNCVWYNQLPSWIAAGNFDNATLLGIVAEHCSTIVANWAGQIYAWDVINEPFNDDGTYRTDIWYNVTGTSYIPTALRAARAADPAAKLYINDYNIEGTGAKSTAMVNLVKTLQAEGVPIDGVGIQGHLIVGEVPSTLQANFEQFTALGIEVAITELDIRMTLPSTAALLAQQSIDYATVITACKNVVGCVGVTIWDYTDKYSWVPSTFAGQGAACPWDENLVKKPAYNGILGAW